MHTGQEEKDTQAGAREQEPMSLECVTYKQHWGMWASLGAGYGACSQSPKLRTFPVEWFNVLKQKKIYPQEQHKGEKNSLWKKHPAHPHFQANSTLLQSAPCPGAYLAGKSQTSREAVPANFLQGTCNFLLGLSSSWLPTASWKKLRATSSPELALPIPF